MATKAKPPVTRSRKAQGTAKKRIRKIFEITGLDASIPIFDTAQDAITG